MPEASVVAREDTKLLSRTKCLACVSHRSVMHTSSDTVGSGVLARRGATRVSRDPTTHSPSASCVEHSEPSPRRGDASSGDALPGACSDDAPSSAASSSAT